MSDLIKEIEIDGVNHPIGAKAENISVDENTNLIEALNDKVNVQSDWSETNKQSDAYIQNKPVIPSVGDGIVTIIQGGQKRGSFSMNQSGNTTINLEAGGGGIITDTTDLVVNNSLTVDYIPHIILDDGNVASNSGTDYAEYLQYRAPHNFTQISTQKDIVQLLDKTYNYSCSILFYLSSGNSYDPLAHLEKDKYYLMYFNMCPDIHIPMIVKALNNVQHEGMDAYSISTICYTQQSLTIPANTSSYNLIIERDLTLLKEPSSNENNFYPFSIKNNNIILHTIDQNGNAYFAGDVSATDSQGNQYLLTQQVKTDDIWIDNDFPLPSKPFTRIKIPSLNFLKKYLKYTPDQSLRIDTYTDIIPAGTTETPPIPRPGTLTSTMKYIIVEDQKINNYNPETEIIFSKAKLFTTESFSIGDTLRILTYTTSVQVPVGGDNTRDRFVDKTNLVTNFNDTLSSLDVYSAQVIYEEIQTLRNCIENLYAKMQTS